MPSTNHSPAIIRSRDEVEKYGGLEAFDKSSTVSTMLFGCKRWLQTQATMSTPEEVERIENIQHELETWMEARHLKFEG